MAERNREENGEKGETREQSRKHKEESLSLLVIQMGQMGRERGIVIVRKRAGGTEKEVKADRQDRQKGHKAWKGYVCAEKRKIQHIKLV